MKLSIVIVTYNCIEYLRGCLDSIKINPPHQSCELIVVDNASTDNTVEIVTSKYPEVRIIANPTNAGFGVANNIGMNAADGEYILFLNPDTKVLENSIDCMISALNKRSDVGIVGCRVLMPEGGVQPFIFGNDPKLSYLIKRAILMAVFKKFAHDWEKQEVQEVDWVTGACMMVRASLVKAVGGFDEKMFLYFEDNELAFRMRRHGSKALYYPYAEIIHYGGKSMGNRDAARKDAYFDSLRYFYHKHYGQIANLLLPAFIALYRPVLERRSAKMIGENS